MGDSLKLRKVRIFTDSTADLSTELIRKYGITVMPLYITLGEKTYKDMLEVTAEDIFAHCSAGGDLPKTSAVSIVDYTEAFKPVIEAGETIIHFTISADFSACYQNAVLAAKEIGNIYVVDTRNLSTGIGQLVIMASELAEKGLSAEEICDEVTSAVPRLDVSFVLNDLKYLYKGGRCSGVAALGANVLKLKPCIEVVDGKMVVGKKYRGSFEKCAEEYIKDRLFKKDDIDLHRIFLTYTGCECGLIEKLAADIKNYLPFEEVLLTEAGSTISGHCGPGCLGILYLHRK